MGVKPQTLVILGAGVGGVTLAHHVLRFTVPKVPGLRVVLVSPNTDFYWNLASPRALVADDFAEKLFQPLAPAFEKYGDKVELVYGAAESLQPDQNAVVVALNGGGSRTISYDAIVIATGSNAREGMPWKSVGSTEATKKMLHELRLGIDAARTIVVAGNGTTGIEIAGELGDLLVAGEPKEVYFVIDQRLPASLPVKDSVRDAIRSTLEKNKVKIVPNVKVTSATVTGTQTVLELSPANKDGQKQTLTADVYLPAFGLVPNTSFVPAELLAADGRVKQTTKLRAEGQQNIFVIGDAGNLEPAKIIGVDSQVHHLGKVFQTYFTTGAVTEYKPNDKFMMGVSLGKDAGTGQAMGMKIFSFLVWYMKSRYMGLNWYADLLKGTRTVTGNLKG